MILFDVLKTRQDSWRRLSTFPLLLFFLMGAASAQTTIGLVPGMVVQEFKPGQPFEMEFAIANGTSSAIEMRGLVNDWWYNEKNEKVFNPPSNAPQSAANWIEVVPRMFTVPPKSSSKVKVIVTPPAKAAGGYYAAVFFDSKPELSQPATAERKAVFANIRLGSLILLSAENTASYQIALDQVVLTVPTGNSPLKIDVNLENKSNTHIFPRMQLAVMNDRHELVAKAEGEIKRFLPGQKDRISVTWDGALAAGEYHAILTLIYGDGKIRTQDFNFKVPS